MSTFHDATLASFTAPSVVLLTSPTCGPCKAMKPILERLARDLDFHLTVLSAPEVPNLCRAYEVRMAPTVLILSAGTIVGKFSGARGEARLVQILHEHHVTQMQLPLDGAAS